MSEWFRVGFKDAKSHAVSRQLLGALVIDMADRGHEVENFETRYGIEHARAMGGNPARISEWGFDMGGMCYVDEPREVLTFDALNVEVPCVQFVAIRRAIDQLELRRFASGEPYYKLKIWIHATVLTPDQHAELASVMRNREAAAKERDRAFSAELEQRRQKRNAGVNL